MIPHGFTFTDHTGDPVDTPESYDEPLVAAPDWNDADDVRRLRHELANLFHDTFQDAMATLGDRLDPGDRLLARLFVAEAMLDAACSLEEGAANIALALRHGNADPAVDLLEMDDMGGPDDMYPYLAEIRGLAAHAKADGNRTCVRVLQTPDGDGYTAWNDDGQVRVDHVFSVFPDDTDDGEDV